MNIFKRLRILASILTLALLGACAEGGKPLQPVDPRASLDSLDSQAFVQRMGLGWNLGNTLEACGDWIVNRRGNTVSAFETAWGNPVTTREMFHAIRQSGFSSVRIPVAWSNRISPDYTINPELMNRVQVVVNAAMNEGLIVIINIHYDGGWWKGFSRNEAGTMARYKKMWGQIAERFKEYPVGLVFESANEELSFDDIWKQNQSGAGGKFAALGLTNRINQAFVDLVRASGGKNGRRQLLIASYSTSLDLAMDPFFHMPKDPAKREIVSVHYYTPPQFAILSEDASWGKARKTWGTPGDLAELDAFVRKLSRLVSRGVPVIIGEYGCPVEKKDPESVRKYLLTVAGKAYGKGACPMLWDAGGNFNRQTLTWKDPQLAQGYRAIVTAPRF